MDFKLYYFYIFCLIFLYIINMYTYNEHRYNMFIHAFYMITELSTKLYSSRYYYYYCCCSTLSVKVKSLSVLFKY